MLSKTFNIQIKYRSTKIKQSAKRYFYQLFCYKTRQKALKTSENDVDTLQNFKSPFPTLQSANSNKSKMFLFFLSLYFNIR
ncbi:MAG TPA: hypothetical protein DCO90_19850 [Sphingobacterium sp.]|nr:hypothetical protein [Sphingobacterium sp.]